MSLTPTIRASLTFKSNAGWTDDQYATNKTRYIPAAVVGARMFAAACLYRLTGEIGYRIKFEVLAH